MSLRYRGQIKRTSQNGTNGRIGGKSSDGGDVDAGAYSMKSLVEEQIILTARECEVLALVARGLTDPQIAIKLSLSPRTIHSHLYSIYNKLQVTNRTAAIHYALQYDLV